MKLFKNLKINNSKLNIVISLVQCYYTINSSFLFLTMELSALPIQEEILATIHQEKDIMKIHDKLNGLIDEYGWQYPHYLMNINFSNQSGKKNSSYLTSILEHFTHHPKLLGLEKEDKDNFFLIEQDSHIQILAHEELFYPTKLKTIHLVPLFLNMYARETKDFDINHFNWSTQDDSQLNPFFYALFYDCQYFIIDYVKKEIPFFNHEQKEQIHLYETLIEEKELPNKPFIKTLFEKYKLEAMIEENIEPQRKYKI